MQEYENKGFFGRNVVWLVVLVALVIFGYLLFTGYGSVLNTGIDGMSTVTGSFSCLPLQDEAVADVQDCILGIEADDGFFYALDISRIQDANSDLTTDDTIAVTGTLQPVPTNPDSEWSSFDIEGVILVNTLLRTR